MYGIFGDRVCSAGNKAQGPSCSCSRENSVENRNVPRTRQRVNGFTYACWRMKSSRQQGELYTMCSVYLEGQENSFLECKKRKVQQVLWINHWWRVKRRAKMHVARYYYIFAPSAVESCRWFSFFLCLLETSTEYCGRILNSPHDSNSRLLDI